MLVTSGQSGSLPDSLGEYLEVVELITCANEDVDVTSEPHFIGVPSSPEFDASSIFLVLRFSSSDALGRSSLD